MNKKLCPNCQADVKVWEEVFGETHVCEMLEAVKEQKLSRCPYHRGILAGDETGDWCELSDHPCMVAYGDYGCEEMKNDDNQNRCTQKI